MGLFSKLLSSLFGSKPQQTAATQPVADSTGKELKSFFSRWERERLERVKKAEAELKDWLIAYILDKKDVPFTWESGNDEAFVTVDDANPVNDEKVQALEEYIVDKLDIPDAGEFQMTGSGSIYLDGNAIKIKHASVLKEIVDYNEETEEEVYGENVVTNSGEEIIFTI